MTVGYGRFPVRRMRRMRDAPWMRDLVRETRPAPSDLIWPTFVTEGSADVAVPSFPGVKRQCLASLCHSAKRAYALGVRAIMVFPYVDSSRKDAIGTEATRPGNLIAQAVAEIKKAAPDIGVICDVALDPYTDHGHDGVFMNGRIDNDATLQRLCEQALCLADAGADMLAPSDMMDGRVGAIRAALDESGRAGLPIMSYAAKFASAYYGPFRHAVGSASALRGGDKKTYQIEPANGNQAVLDALLDAEEGADMLMVKPALPYLDVVSRLRRECALPVVAYQVSGEYAMMRAGADAGAFDFMKMLREQIICCKRAGAVAVATYGALELAKELKEHPYDE
ncbi:MAG: porphobilinogen synthase [Rickettsiales bacterium]